MSVRYSDTVQVHIQQTWIRSRGDNKGDLGQECDGLAINVRTYDLPWQPIDIFIVSICPTLRLNTLQVHLPYWFYLPCGTLDTPSSLEFHH